MILEGDRPRRGQRRRRYGRPRVEFHGRSPEAAWRERLLPELIWIAALHRSLGHDAAEWLAGTLSRTALGLAPGSPGWFGAASDYEGLDGRRLEMLVELLELEEGALSGLREGLGAFLTAFPDYPLAFLATGLPPSRSTPSSVDPAALVVPLLDQASPEAIHAQALVLGLGLAAGRLEAAPDGPWRDRTALRDYPDTERSLVVAEAVRSIAPILVADPESARPPAWIRSFRSRIQELLEGGSPEAGAGWH